MVSVRTAVVVGSGVVGLTTAWHLQQRGWRVRLLADRPVAESTSYLAAAVWFPTHVGPRGRVVGWGTETYDVLADRARDGVPGVLMRESLALHRDPPEQPWWAEAVGGVRSASTVDLPPGYRYGLRFTVPLVEMPTHPPWLADEVARRGAVGCPEHRAVRAEARRVHQAVPTGRRVVPRDDAARWGHTAETSCSTPSTRHRPTLPRSDASARPSAGGAPEGRSGRALSCFMPRWR